MITDDDDDDDVQVLAWRNHMASYLDNYTAVTLKHPRSG